MQISGKWSKSKPKVDFQYGGRLFFQNGSSYISAMNWDMSTKFGLLIDIDLLKLVTSTNRKLELELSSRGRHLENRQDWGIKDVDIIRTVYLRREWSDIGEMWHADAEWHDNYGDDVKMETVRKWRTEKKLLIGRTNMQVRDVIPM